MQKKLKKQRKKLIIKTSAILIAVWLILSCAYSVLAFFSEKDREYRNAQIAFSMWQRNMEPYVTNPVLFMDYARITTTVSGHSKEESTSDVSFDYNHNVNIVVKEQESKQEYDSDDIININFTAETDDPEYRETYYGYISYNRFRKSMTDEQYDKILSYLDNQPEGLYYYELLCTEFYQNSSGELIPKQVQIVSTRDVHKWYVQDEAVETFDLDPTGTDRLALYYISYLNRNEIPEAFIRHTFGSNGLRETAQQLAQEKIEEMNTNGLYADDYIGLLQINAYEYIYYDANSFTTRSINTSSSSAEEDVNNDIFSVYLTNDKEYVVYYARRFNVLEGCIGNILTVTGILFLFFLIIGVILTVMMWRTLKMQIVEEQKRRDMTNALAHDIKTPLFILSGYAGNLKENVQTDKRVHYADVIVEQTEEVNRRVNRMLELSKLDSPNLKLNKQSFDLAELISEILSNYEVLPDGKSINFTVDTPDGKCIITADRHLMKRAIENLVDNAVKYADYGTVIKVVAGKEGVVITNHYANAKGLAIRSSESNSNLKEYYNTKFKYKHIQSGFGLPITESIMTLHKFKLLKYQDTNLITFEIKM
jgi:nitrogen-specific signal transduction histidine kinase